MKKSMIAALVLMSASMAHADPEANGTLEYRGTIVDADKKSGMELASQLETILIHQRTMTETTGNAAWSIICRSRLIQVQPDPKENTVRIHGSINCSNRGAALVSIEELIKYVTGELSRAAGVQLEPVGTPRPSVGTRN